VRVKDRLSLPARCRQRNCVDASRSHALRGNARPDALRRHFQRACEFSRQPLTGWPWPSPIGRLGREATRSCAMRTQLAFGA